MKSDETYLKHILEAIEKVEKYLDGYSYGQYSRDDRTVDAVVRELTIIGEAASKIGARFRKIHPDLPYREMQNMRNFVVHEYFAVDRKIVWDTCCKDLPKLKTLISCVV